MDLEAFDQRGEQRLADRDGAGVDALGEQRVQRCSVGIARHRGTFGLGQLELEFSGPTQGGVTVLAKLGGAFGVQVGG